VVKVHKVLAFLVSSHIIAHFKFFVHFLPEIKMFFGLIE